MRGARLWMHGNVDGWKDDQKNWTGGIHGIEESQNLTYNDHRYFEPNTCQPAESKN